MRPVRFHPAAQAELRHAVEFYEARAAGLGGEFEDEVESAVRRLAELPYTGSADGAATRRKVLRRFPFVLVYLIRAEDVVVVAVMHQRQRPGYWRGRI